LSYTCEQLKATLKVYHKMAFGTRNMLD